MNAFLITFKPETENPNLGWPIGDLLSMVKRNRLGKTVIERWRFHNRKDVSAGDRVFMLIQGKLGPAIIGYGQISGEPTKSPKGKQNVELISIVDPTGKTLASKDELKRIKGSESLWRTQASGIIIPPPIASKLETLVRRNASKLTSGQEKDRSSVRLLNSLDDPQLLEEGEEGRLILRKHLAHERNRKLVKSKLSQSWKAKRRLSCEACGFDFAARYGKRGEKYMECHHVKPVESFSESHVTRLRDLALVCSNCHRMIHRQRPWLSIAKLKSLIRIGR
jgi:predicted HNH restriction endonuclease